MKAPAAAPAKKRKPPTRLSTSLERAVKRGSAVLEGPIVKRSRRQVKELANELKGTLEEKAKLLLELPVFHGRQLKKRERHQEGHDR
jgi:hypothetical protein